MVDFFEILVQPENMLFTVSLMVFVGSLALLFLGFGIGGSDIDMDFEIEDGEANKSSGYPVICFTMPFFGFFGLLGILSNWILTDALDVTAIQKAVISTLLSAAISYQLCVKFAGFIAKSLPSVESYGLSNADLEGSLATVLGEKMDSEKTVRISVTDKRKNIFTLRGQLLAGHSEVEHGGIVRIVKQDLNSDICLCEPASASFARPSPSGSASSS